jgi:hypothetical protein
MVTASALSTDQYWEQLAIQTSDLDHLANFLVASERPHSLDDLAFELTRYRFQQMTELLESTLSQGRVYRPGETYQVGEQVSFPHMGHLAGEVTEVRRGRNPEYEPFSVIRVELEQGGEREFAVELLQEHPLNTATYQPDDTISVDEIYAQQGPAIREALRRALEMSSQFVNVADKWFVRALLMEIEPGQLNIAEALLDMAGGGPIRSETFLDDLDLPEEISRPLQLFSLEYALFRDRRFDEVGPAGYALWQLRSLEPKAVLETPKLLRYIPIPYNRQVLDDVMLMLEEQVADEWSDLPLPAASAAPVTIVVTYPHWRVGTLPLASHVAGFFPTARVNDRIRFTFIDTDSGDEFPGWVVRSGRYVYGLKEWYTAKQAIVGTFVDLAQGEEPGQIHIAARPIRGQRREWLRTVTVVESDNLTFEVTRTPVSCEFDELAAVAVANPDAVDALREQFNRAPLESLLERAFSGLAGLSLQRAVHAMTLYSVINLMRRVPPAPMLATLAVSPRYTSLGDNYWAYQGEE